MKSSRNLVQYFYFIMQINILGQSFKNTFVFTILTLQHNSTQGHQQHVVDDSIFCVDIVDNIQYLIFWPHLLLLVHHVPPCLQLAAGVHEIKLGICKCNQISSLLLDNNILPRHQDGSILIGRDHISQDTSHTYTLGVGF